MYCQICLVGGAAKHQARRKLKKNLDNVNFKVYAKKWKNKNHNYYKVFGFVDRENSDENLAHKFCKAIFFKDSYLNSQPFIPSTPKESEISSTSDVSSIDQSSDFRKRSRQGLQYKFNQAYIKCIIGNKDQYTKGKVGHLQNISLKRTVDETNKAEDTMKEHAETHLKSKNERSIDTSRRVLLVLGICCRCIIPQIIL